MRDSADAGGARLGDLWRLLAADPGIGVLVFDRAGQVLFANEVSAQVYFDRPPSDVAGRALSELHGSELAEEFRRTLSLLEQGEAIQFREVWHGRQVLATARLVRGEAEGEDQVLLLSRLQPGELDAGEHDMPLVYSEFVQLGPLEILSPRELEVLCLVGQGLATKEIARLLYRSPRTVDVHRRAIGSKLNETSAVKLAQLAAQAGLVQSDSQRKRLESGPEGQADR